MKRGWIGIAAGALALGALALMVVLVAGDPSVPGSGGSAATSSDRGAPATRAELDELRAALEFERHARAALAEEVAELRRALAEGRVRGGAAAPAAAAAAAADASAARTAAAAPDTRSGAARLQDDEDAEPRFDAEALVQAGLPDADVERLRARWEAFELDKLEVNDLGLREGWKGRRFRREHRALREALRAELGDEWDAYLYATGKENRVRVNNVLADSLASNVGFEEGDLILSYAGERVYQPGELQSRSARCPDGAFVSVEVVRDGELDTLRVPCGPLGVLVDHVKEAPRFP
jgi:hypothetical protein